MLFNRNAPRLHQALSNAVCVQQDPDTGGVACAIGGTTLDELIDVFDVKRPTATEADLDSRTADVRRAIQRRFTGDRSKNCLSFKAYILGMAQGRDGVLPPLTLYCPDQFVLNDQGIVTRPSGSPVVAIDGETQLEAVFAAAEEDEAVRCGLALTFILHAGVKPTSAQLYTHDLNAFGRSISEQEVVGLNVHSPIVASIAAGVQASDIERGMDAINRSGAGMGSKFKPYATTYARLLHLTAGVYHGIEHANVSLDAYLSAHAHEESMSFDVKTKLADAVADYLTLPRAQRLALGNTESRALGMVIHARGGGITEHMAARLLRNRASLSAHGPKSAKFKSLTAGLI